MCDSSHILLQDLDQTTIMLQQHIHYFLLTFQVHVYIYTYFQHHIRHTQLITQVWPILHKHTIESEVRSNSSIHDSIDLSLFSSSTALLLLQWIWRPTALQVISAAVPPTSHASSHTDCTIHTDVGGACDVI